MEISVKQLRIEPGRIISHAANGQEITVTYRGKPRAKIVPLVSRKELFLEELPALPYDAFRGVKDQRVSGQQVGRPTHNDLFGLWKNREDTMNVEQFVRNLRKGRKNDH